MNNILLTGASSPLGHALAHYLVHTFPHASLALTGRSLEQLNQLKNVLPSSTSITLLALDLLVKQDQITLIEWIKDHTPDLLINNAGAGLYGEALTHPIQEQIDLLELNTRVVLELSLHAAHALIKKGKKGTILNVSSAADCFSYPTFSVYAASKACVTNFSKSLDDEMRLYGVRILVSAPGPIATQFRERASKGHSLAPARGALSCSEAAEEILKQIKTKKPYVVFPWKIKVMRTLVRILPQAFINKLLKGVLKSEYPARPIASDQDT